jgi:hypothetical protein
MYECGTHGLRILSAPVLYVAAAYRPVPMAAVMRTGTIAMASFPNHCNHYAPALGIPTTLAHYFSRRHVNQSCWIWYAHSVKDLEIKERPNSFALLPLESGIHTSHAPPSQKSDSGGSGRSSLVSITIEPNASLLVSPSFVFALLHSVCNFCLVLREKADLLDDLTDKECATFALTCFAGGQICLEANVS